MPQLKPVVSSQIKAIGFDPVADVAYIEFATKRSRSVYEYRNVTASHVARILFAESIGKAFAQILKPNPKSHPFQKLADSEVEAIETTETPTWLPVVEGARR